MPQVAPELVRARAKRLRERAEARRVEWLKGLVGTMQEVLVERSGTQGHSSSFAEVRLPSQPVGEIVRVKIEGVANGMLEGIIA
jgi:threonylcarbamoyladenosine tRNA methylthiotransferase MtaB